MNKNEEISQGGKSLADRREALGLTQGQLAMRLNIRREYWCKIEKGKVALSRKVASQLEVIERGLVARRVNYFTASAPTEVLQLRPCDDALPARADAQVRAARCETKLEMIKAALRSLLEFLEEQK